MSVDTSFFLPAPLVLDISEIDDQHSALFAQLADIKAICLEANQLPLAQAEALLSALQEHFATEERLADGAGLDFSEHARKHEKMFAVIRNAISQAHEGPRDVFGLLRFVEYWFERHIGEEDRQLSIGLLNASFCSSLTMAEPPQERDHDSVSWQQAVGGLN